MKSENEYKVKKMYQRVSTPEYDVKDKVLAEINKQKLPRKISRKLLIAAVMCLILLLAGTAAAAGVFDHIFTINSDGPEQIIEENFPTPTPLPDPETYDESLNEDPGYIASIFANEAEYGECRFAVYLLEDGRSAVASAVSHVLLDDFDLMKEYIKGSNSPLPYPDYIPDGYEFLSGEITFYLDERIFDLEPRSNWEEDGIRYYIFDLPAGFEKNIIRYSMKFVDSQENQISVFFQLCGSDWGFEEIELQDDDTAEYLEIDNFDDAVLVNSEEDKYYNYRFHLFSFIEPVESSEFSFFLLDEENENKSDWDYITTYDAAIAYVSSEDLSRQEIIKFVEGFAY